MQQAPQSQSPARNRGGLLSPSPTPGQAPAQPVTEDEEIGEIEASEEEEAIFEDYYVPMKALLYQEDAFGPLMESFSGGGRQRFAQAMSSALNGVYEVVEKQKGIISNVEVLFYMTLDVEQATGTEVDDRMMAAALTQTMQDWARANIKDLAPEDQAAVKEALQSMEGQKVMGMMQQQVGQVGQAGQPAANAPQAQPPRPQGGMING
jgi:hypothetical protein